MLFSPDPWSFYLNAQLTLHGGHKDRCGQPAFGRAACAVAPEQNYFVVIGGQDADLARLNWRVLQILGECGGEQEAQSYKNNSQWHGVFNATSFRTGLYKTNFNLT
ncbi:MAG: hypothetical protein ABFD89_25225 [Bryobacteraceae bacterium]